MVRGCFGIDGDKGGVENYVNLDVLCISVHCCSGKGVVAKRVR